MKTVDIKIKKMSCSGCVGRIYRALSQYDGVIRSSVDDKNSNVNVRFNEQEISENKIKEIINTLGFEVIQNV